MENKNKLTLVAFSVLILLCSIYSSTMNYANAFGYIDVTYANYTNNFSAISTRDTLTLSAVEYVLGSTAPNGNFLRISPSSHAVISNNVMPTTGVMNGVPFDLGTGGSPSWGGLACTNGINPAKCYTTYDNSTHDTFVRFIPTSPPVLDGFIRETGASMDFKANTFNAMYVDSVAGGVNYVYIGRTCSNADTDVLLYAIDGTNMVYAFNPGTLDPGTTCAGASVGANFGATNINAIYRQGTYGQANSYVIAGSGAGSVRIFSSQSNGFICAKAISTPVSITYDSANTEFLVSYGGTSPNIDRINEDCVDNGDITGATIGITGVAINDIYLNGTRQELYVVGDNAKIMVVNSTSYAKYWEIGDKDNGVSVWYVGSQVVSLSVGNSRYLIVNDIGQGGATGSTVCIDTNLDHLTDLCFGDTNGDGIADNGILGGLGAYRSNQNITSITADWFCAFGIGSCTDKNPKTNGTGLWLLLWIIIMSYAFLVFIHYQAQRMVNKSNVQVMDVLHINPILLLVMLLIDIGITFALGWIPDVIFYTIIVVLVGLAGFGIYKKVSSGGG